MLQITSELLSVELTEKINQRSAIVGVIGLGYVGLPLALAFAGAGFEVVGIDVSTERVAAINRGESYVEDIPADVLSSYIVATNGQQRFRATSDFDTLHQLDAVIICVPTPLDKTKDPDMSYLIAATDEIARRLHRGLLVVLESTTYPGTTEEILLPRLAKEGECKVGIDFFLAFSPERIDPGRKDWTVTNTPKVMGGITPQCLAMARLLYESAIQEVVPVSSPRVAEMVKLLENTFRAVNIGLVNEVAIMCDHLGIDVWEVVEAAKTKPFGYMPFVPGPGLGGHCIPIDPEYLAWKLKTLNYNARFIQLAAEINFGMPAYLFEKITDALNDQGKAVKGAGIVVLGVAYKANIGDLRESPALDIVRLLLPKGALVNYHDPYVPEFWLDGRRFEAIQLTAAVLHAADCVVIATDHQVYDWTWIVEHSRLVVDSRNATRHVEGFSEKIVKL